MLLNPPNDSQIKLISPEETLTIRQQILRPHQTLQECIYATDHNANTMHYGAFENNKLIGIVSIHRENRIHHDNITAYRLRGLAVIDSKRNYGLGSKLLLACITFCQKHAIQELWCNARVTAINFYRKNDFEITGASFEIKGIGKHYIAVKKI